MNFVIKRRDNSNSIYRINCYHNDAGEHVFVGVGPLYMGIENECRVLSENESEFVGLTRRLVARDNDTPTPRVDKNVFYDVQHDCSICTPGGTVDCELITMPMDWPAWEEAHPAMVRFYRLARRLGLRGDKRGCGIHISISVEGFTSKEAVKLFFEFFRDYPEFVEAFGRRYANCYCERIDDCISFEDFVYDNINGYGDRYQQLNFCHLNENDDNACGFEGRIEIRSFKSTTNVDTIYAYLDFVYTLVQGCNALTSVDELISYLWNNNKGYVSSYINKRKSDGKWNYYDITDSIR